MIAGVEVKTAHCSNYARALNRTAVMPGLGPAPTSLLRADVGKSGMAGVIAGSSPGTAKTERVIAGVEVKTAHPGLVWRGWFKKDEYRREAALPTWLSRST